MASFKSGLARTFSASQNEKQPLIFSNPRKSADLMKLSLWKKIGFAVGSMPFSMCSTIMGFYLTVFLLEVALVDPTFVLIIVLLGRIWDGITDPMVGYLCTKTKTKLGQFRPWLLLSAVPTSIVYFFLWYVPKWNVEELKLVYFLLIYLCLEALLTCVHVPYTSLTMHLSYNQKETDSVTMFRVAFEVIGTLIGIAIYTLFYALIVKGQEDDCADDVRTYNSLKEYAYRYHALTIGVLIIILLLITFLTVKEQREVTERKTSISLISVFRETFGFRPYRDLILLELFAWLAVQFVQGNFAFYIKYSLSLSKQYVYVIAVLLIFTILWMPVWQYILLKFGKKTAFLWGMWILMPCLLLLLFLDHYPPLIYPVAMVGGGGVAAAYLIPWSMVPDVVDAASLNTGIRREELFYAFFVFGNKFSAGMTLGISTALYKLAGYDEKSCDQPWPVPLLFKLLVSGPPIFFILLSLIFLWHYPINKEMRADIKQRLQARRKYFQSDTEESDDTANRFVTPSPSSSSKSSPQLSFRQLHTSDEVTLDGEIPVSKL